eukprot:jgi/Botrbrau1/981/Bobra.114_1s0022.2
MILILELCVPDNNSTYGTSIGNEEAKGSVRTLREGDIVQFGQKAQFRIEWQPVVLYAASPQRTLQELISSIGAEVVATWTTSCTHVVKDDGDHVDVLACAAALAGIPVIRQTWVQAVLERSSPHDALPDPCNHLPDLVIPTKGPGSFCSLLSAARKTTLSGFVFTISSSVPQADHLAWMLRSAGGQVADVGSTADNESNKSIVVVRNDASPGPKGRQRTTVTLLLSAVICGTTDDLLLPPLWRSLDSQRSALEGAAEAKPSTRGATDAIYFETRPGGETPSKKRTGSAATQGGDRPLGSKGHGAAVTSEADPEAREHEGAGTTRRRLGLGRKAVRGPLPSPQTDLPARSCQDDHTRGLVSLDGNLPDPVRERRDNIFDTSAKGFTASRGRPAPTDAGLCAHPQGHQVLTREGTDQEAEPSGRRVAEAEACERSGHGVAVKPLVVESYSERDGDRVAQTVVTSPLIFQGQIQRRLPRASGCSHVPDFKVFRKQSSVGVGHIVRPVLGYARGVYSERAVDADEFLRRQQEKELMDRTADDLFNVNMKSGKGQGKSQVLSRGAFSFRR